jgi:molecular chaperone DnaK (HSP70)
MKTLGIDLGTTNSTLAVCREEGALPEVLDIAQIEKAGVVSTSPQMPSALYIPFEDEFAEADTQLPWGSCQHIVGNYAKSRASEVPDRVILSAKSWLCHSGVDRKEKLLPWKSEIKEDTFSPFETSVAFLQHLASAARHKIDLDFDQTVLCVPASFDEVARNLTAEAAEVAGLHNFTLLEEPLAALYAWIARAGDSWREQLKVGDTILVCDLGGGTADFTLVSVGESNGELTLERLSVGDHILLGGDNMDLALAYQLKSKFEAQGKKLDGWQFQSLVREAQRVKERFLSTEDQNLPVTLAGKGSSLFASTLQVEAQRDEVLALIRDGFFPNVGSSELPGEKDVLGLQEYGLPFEAEPALTKHLAKFLRQSAKQSAETDADLLIPSAILFNGGVCKSALIRQRLMEVLYSWSSGVSVRELEENNYDTAVAEGAAHYAKIRHEGSGLRIRAGTSRSYYLGIESSMPAVPGFKPPVKGVCVVPQGMEEGSEATLAEQTFSLRTGREVEFRFFSSQDRGDDAPGTVLDDAEEELSETSRLRVTLPNQEGSESESVPVSLLSKVTEIGTLELWMKARDGDDSWKLEFDVRAEKKSPQISY